MHRHPFAVGVVVGVVGVWLYHNFFGPHLPGSTKGLAVLGLSVVVAFSGYALFAWGVAFLTHATTPTGNTPSFLDLVWPGKWTSGKAKK